MRSILRIVDLSRLSAAALGLGALFAMGCARGPDVAVGGLDLRKVVIYRNGVGYFERAGNIDAEQVTFKVRGEKVGDFLATLAVIERGGSSVRSASFPVEVDKDDDEADDDVPEDRRFEVLLKPIEKKKEKKDKLKTVKLTLDGREHDLVVGYVAETPVWKPSYRLVLDAKGASGKGTAHLQAWGIVQNLSGEDWKGVQLSLIAGAPLAFQATLDKPVIPPRPVVTDQGEVIASVPLGETTLAEAPPPPPPPPPTSEAEASGFAGLDDLLDEEESEFDAKKDKREAKAGEARTRAARRPRPMKKSNAPMAGGMAQAPAPALEPMPMQNPSMPRNVNALAAVAMEGGTTRYDLPFRVDIPKDSATMVLLLARPVPGEGIFLFAPDGGVPESTSHPFRVVRFTNDSQGLLERGPIAVFENGSFLGQGMVDPLPPGATATVPFALERSIAVTNTRNTKEEGARLAQIEGGRIQIERDWVTVTKYTVKNGDSESAKVLLKHPRQYDTRLQDPPKGTEDNVGTGSALVPLVVAPRSTQALEVDERRATRRPIDWLDPLADQAVKAYMADSRADQVVVAELRKAWEAREKLRKSTDERNKLQTEKNRIEREIDQTSTSLKRIEKNKLADDLRKELTNRLAKLSSRSDEINKKLIVVEMQLNEQAVRFRDLINPIKMLKPLPVP